MASWNTFPSSTIKFKHNSLRIKGIFYYYVNHPSIWNRRKDQAVTMHLHEYGIPVIANSSFLTYRSLKSSHSAFLGYFEIWFHPFMSSGCVPQNNVQKIHYGCKTKHANWNSGTYVMFENQEGVCIVCSKSTNFGVDCWKHDMRKCPMEAWTTPRKWNMSLAEYLFYWYVLMCRDVSFCFIAGTEN